jgi:hypothetical protein
MNTPAKKTPAYLEWKKVFDEIQRLRVKEAELRKIVEAEQGAPPFQPGV